MAFVDKKSRDAKFDDQDKSRETGEEAQRYEDTAEEFSEEGQEERNTMADMEGIGKDRLEVTKVLKFIDPMAVKEHEAKDRTDRQRCDIEGGFGVGGGEELFHV